MDYALPIASELPRFELDHTETPTRSTPWGQGRGRGGDVGATPAVVNAVVDALAHLGVKDIDMPITSEKVWRLLQGRREPRGGGRPECAKGAKGGAGR